MPAGRITEMLLEDALRVTSRVTGNIDDTIHSIKPLHRKSLKKELTVLRNIYNSGVTRIPLGVSAV